MQAIAFIGAVGMLATSGLALCMGLLLFAGLTPGSLARGRREPQRVLGAAIFLWWVPAFCAGLGLLWLDAALAAASGVLWALAGLCVVSAASAGVLEAIPVRFRREDSAEPADRGSTGARHDGSRGGR